MGGEKGVLFLQANLSSISFPTPHPTPPFSTSVSLQRGLLGDKVCIETSVLSFCFTLLRIVPNLGFLFFFPCHFFFRANFYLPLKTLATERRKYLLLFNMSILRSLCSGHFWFLQTSSPWGNTHTKKFVAGKKKKSYLAGLNSQLPYVMYIWALLCCSTLCTIRLNFPDVVRVVGDLQTWVPTHFGKQFSENLKWCPLIIHILEYMNRALKHKFEGTTFSCLFWVQRFEGKEVRSRRLFWLLSYLQEELEGVKTDTSSRKTPFFKPRVLQSIKSISKQKFDTDLN